MKTANLVVLAFEGPVLRAYLEFMRASGFAPRRIIDLRVGTKRGSYRLARGVLGATAAERLYRWIRRKRFARQEDRDLCSRVLESETIRPDYFGALPLREYCPNVAEIHLDDLNDPLLTEILREERDTTFLFTGGGILKSPLLNIPGSRFLHVHPGIVPDIRGSEGLLWSLLLRGRPGTSAFFMNEGIDTGDVLKCLDFDRPAFQLDPKRYGYDSVHRALLYFYDPLLRAKLLAEVIRESQGDPRVLKVRPQDPRKGHTFFRMHRRLRDRVFDLLAAP